MIASPPYPATRLNWPPKLVGSSHQVQLLFHRSEQALPVESIEVAGARALEGAEVTWKWSGNYATLMIKGRITVAALDAAMAAIDAVHPAAQRFYTGDAMRPKRPKSALPAVEMVPIHPREIPAPLAGTTIERTPPPGLFGTKLHQAWKSSRGVWIAVEYLPDAWSICTVREDRPEERASINVPRHECSSVVFSRDGERALINGRWTIREVEVATLQTIRQVLVPRTIRDNNGWTSVLYHPTNAQRLVVGTETGVFLVASNGDATAFAHCLDVARLASTATGRNVFASQEFPARGELFALDGDELRSIGKLKPIGELTVHGERIFSRQSKEKAFEIIRADARAA
jgi:hypothetical protein